MACFSKLLFVTRVFLYQTPTFLLSVPFPLWASLWCYWFHSYVRFDIQRLRFDQQSAISVGVVLPLTFLLPESLGLHVRRWSLFTFIVVPSSSSKKICRLKSQHTFLEDNADLHLVLQWRLPDQGLNRIIINIVAVLSIITTSGVF